MESLPWRVTRVGLEGGYAKGFEAGEQLVGASVVAHPDLVVGALVGRDPLSDCLVGDLAGPLEVGTVTPGGVLVAGTVGPPATVRRSSIEPGSTKPLRAMAASSLAIRRASAWCSGSSRIESSFPRGIHHFSHGLLYIYSRGEQHVARDLRRSGKAIGRGDHRRLLAGLGRP